MSFRNVANLLPGLLPASFRGVPFHVIDAGSEGGRRLVATYFPGVDPHAVEDQGVMEGPITVIGFVEGAGYVAQGLALEAAFRAPGPGVYRDPWRGERRVMVPAGGGRVTFSITHLRMAQVEATFHVLPAALPSVFSTFARFVAAIGGMSGAARALVAAALGARNLPVLALALANDAVSGAVGAAISRAGLAPAATVLVPALEEIARDLARGGGARAIDAALGALEGMLVEAARPRPSPMIGAAGTPPPPAPIAPRAGARLSLAIAERIFALPVSLAADEASRLAARAGAVAAAARTAAVIPFESREEAGRWRDEIDAALAGVGAEAQALAPRAAGAVDVWRRAEDARGALAVDLNEIFGRLPRTRALRPGGISALVLAHDLVGDDPRRVVPFAADVVARNRLRHAGALPPAGVEVLL